MCMNLGELRPPFFYLGYVWFMRVNVEQELEVILSESCEEECLVGVKCMWNFWKKKMESWTKTFMLERKINLSDTFNISHLYCFLHVYISYTLEIEIVVLVKKIKKYIKNIINSVYLQYIFNTFSDSLISRTSINKILHQIQCLN